MAILMDGKSLAAKIKSDVLAKANLLKGKGIEPCLAVILVGDDQASAVYVRNKQRDCEECGIRGILIKLPSSTTQAELLSRIKELNADSAIHGILVQQPLPSGIDPFVVTKTISPEKDVDALHPISAGLISQERHKFLPCTPAGVMLLLKHYEIDCEGKHAVVVGRSHIVGKPMAQLLLSENATVSVCHSRTPDLPSITKQADILISAVGRFGMIKKNMVKPGAVVVDVGINKGADGKLAGDVAFLEVEPLVSYITPVPGGVGPMTRAVLMQNTILAAGEILQNKG